MCLAFFGTFLTSFGIFSDFQSGNPVSLAWSTNRVVENCYENVWTTTGFCDMKNLPRSLSRYKRSTNHIQTKLL